MVIPVTVDMVRTSDSCKIEWPCVWLGALRRDRPEMRVSPRVLLVPPLTRFLTSVLFAPAEFPYPIRELRCVVFVASPFEAAFPDSPPLPPRGSWSDRPDPGRSPTTRWCWVCHPQLLIFKKNTPPLFFIANNGQLPRRFDHQISA